MDDETKTDKKSELIRFKLKTLDINEGSGDSSFYAKVRKICCVFNAI